MISRPVYHITHVDNLPHIIAAGRLYSDRLMTRMTQTRAAVVIGYDNIKQRRLNENGVGCHPGTMVGDYVPFYFCPRSVMLFVIWKRATGLTYRGGQEEIVHLVSDVALAVQASAGRPWAFSDGNAGTRYTQYCADLDQLDDFVDWNAVAEKYWSDPAVKERKQAEFLVHDFFPWSAFRRIGVQNSVVCEKVKRILVGTDHKPEVKIQAGWYY